MNVRRDTISSIKQFYEYMFFMLGKALSYYILTSGVNTDPGPGFYLLQKNPPENSSKQEINFSLWPFWPLFVRILNPYSLIQLNRIHCAHY